MSEVKKKTIYADVNDEVGELVCNKRVLKKMDRKLSNGGDKNDMYDVHVDVTAIDSELEDDSKIWLGNRVMAGKCR